MAAHHFDADFLEAQRSVGDPPADAVIAELFAHGSGVAYAASRLLRSLVDNDDIPAAGLPAPVREYFAGGALPAWADRAAIARSGELFHRLAPQIILLLHTMSLPYCYAGRRGVQVLARTGRLHSSAQRRVLETAQFVLDVMAPGGLDHDPGRFGAGLRSAQKVRLMHATIRHFIRADAAWDPAWGTPINQEDLAGTLVSFSGVILSGLPRLGVDLDQQERDDYIHTWNVVGALLGVDERLMAADAAAAERLIALIADRHHEACPEGQMMTRALLDYMEYALPGDALDGLPALLIHEFNGPRLAAILGVERPALSKRWMRVLASLGGAADDLGDESALLRRASAAVGRLLLGALLLAYRGGERSAFSIPMTLRHAHGLGWS